MIPYFANRKIVLASASPRRLELLRQIGLEPLVHPVEVAEEQRLKGRSPAQLVRLNARLKARAAASLNPLPGSIIIGADTVVVLKGRLYGKPGHAAEAAAMLRALSGKVHKVYTGICLIDTANIIGSYGSRCTHVHFAALSEQDIACYVASGEPMDKAGAYGIQGLGGLFVKAIYGDYGTVVGLSLPLLAQLTQKLQKL
jgi:septum formation protein